MKGTQKCMQKSQFYQFSNSPHEEGPYTFFSPNEVPGYCRLNKLFRVILSLVYNPLTTSWSFAQTHQANTYTNCYSVDNENCLNSKHEAIRWCLETCSRTTTTRGTITPVILIVWIIVGGLALVDPAIPPLAFLGWDGIQVSHV